MSNALGLEKISKVTSTSDRSFGIMFGCIFIIIAVIIRLRDDPQNVQLYFLIFGFLALLISFTRPRLLSNPNKLWMKFSLLLARFVSPVVLGVLFYLLISPLALVLRLFRRDELCLKTKKVATNWQSRHISGYSLESFKNQY